MFDLPNISIDSTARFADWMEFCALFQRDGVVSRAKLADVVADCGLLGGTLIDLPAGETPYDDSDELSEDDATERFTDLVFEELRKRQVEQGIGYPFEVRRESLSRSASSWESVPAFAMLLLADISRSYQRIQVTIETNSEFSQLFEKVVESASKGLLHGPCVRFGWPKEPGWPTKINDRISTLGEEIGLELEDLTGKTRVNDSDRGLDVLSKLSFGDPDAGTLFLLTQCATGKNWKKKRGEPSITDWSDIFKWNAPLLRAIAIPWRLDKSTDSGFDRIRTHRHFEALILDRPRLVSGHPDLHLESSVAASIRKWCRAQIKKFPKLKRR